MPWAGGRRRAIGRWAYFAVITAAGSAVLVAAVVTRLRAPVEPIWLALTGLAFAIGLLAVRLPGFPLSFSLADAFGVAATLMFGPGAGAITVACDGLAVSLRLDPAQRTPTRLLFNVTAPSLAVWLAATALFAAVDVDRLASLPAFAGALVLFATVYFLLNSLMVTGAIVVGRDAGWWPAWRDQLLPLWLPQLLGTAIAGLLVLIVRRGDTTLSTIALVAPVLVAGVAAMRRAVGRVRGQATGLAELRLYEAALRSTEDATILCNAEGRVTFMNPAAERLTGWTAADGRSHAVTAVLRLETLSDRDGPEAELFTGEYILTRRDGIKLPIEETRSHIRDEDGSVIGVISTLRDATLRKTLEAARADALEQAHAARAAADEANRSKDEFLATLSHELRTPTTAIIGWTRLLKSGRLDEENAARALEALDRSAQAQHAVLRDLLDLSQIVRGSMRLRLTLVQVARPLREALETVEPAARAKGLDVCVEIADLPAIEADADRLRQVFWNLLSNAVKFTPERGRITVAAQLVDGDVVVDVSDSGSGIPTEFLPFLFEPFRQAAPSMTREYTGLGVGLAIVKHIVEAHGGTVQATSAPAGGSRFAVRLRRQAPTAPAAGVTMNGDAAGDAAPGAEP
jgi:PAS domain S-box-containing protein